VNQKAYGKGSHYIPLGKIQKAWGLKGEVKFALYHSSSEALLKTRQVYRKVGSSFRSTFLNSVKKQGKHWVIQLEGFRSPEATIPLQGEELFLPAEELSQKGVDEYYIFELIGLEVLTPAGKALGHVEEVVNYGASEILVVRDLEKASEILIPLVSDSVKNISLVEKKIIIEPMEGF
jgi:16S rRNA processing protein RimM